MDDLIVIILTLVIVVVGALGQIKKKNLPPPKSEPQKMPDFWSLLSGEDEVLQNNKNIEIIEPEIVREKEEIKTPYLIPPENEGKMNLSKEPIFEPMNEIKKSEGKITETFSLKKAVIYSEILNRKYS